METQEVAEYNGEAHANHANGEAHANGEYNNDESTEEPKKKGKRKKFVDFKRDELEKIGDDVSLCYMCARNDNQLFQCKCGRVYCRECIREYMSFLDEREKEMARKHSKRKKKHEGPQKNEENEALQEPHDVRLIECPAETCVLQIREGWPDVKPVTTTDVLKYAEQLYAVDHEECKPQRVRAIRALRVRNNTFILENRMNVSCCKNSLFDVYEIQGKWAYAVRLSDGIFGWLPIDFVEPVDHPSPICEDDVAKALILFEESDAQYAQYAERTDESPILHEDRPTQTARKNRGRCISPDTAVRYLDITFERGEFFEPK